MAQGTILPPEVIKKVLSPLNHALAAAERDCLEQGIPITALIDLVMEHAISLVAFVEPPGVRAEMVKQLIARISPDVRKHVEARQTTKGGIILPGRAA